ncbi:protein-S-isoprenylcysteine O-methyltransferase Ste14 [Bradyrhizobium elkanii]|jgi:protein-S-isoprenylcysteine O-methyltransferase Ste14|uniref:methyltransferase family protein n=2 Tax=Nitrobacteraceae TaxID=41294 RepID=UPI000487C0AE|nr:methyltransferase [Bradyrhizobium elkanii]MCS3448361.1 protein-S-isoprenylcysteine O-methyltransferase Ste14 [Bradyrhizobium elkanii]MCS3560500.1 protein-S-isoprenylcysteine O-methyltransferase Ste14 [Bradyrhizobium elkanii]MCW2149657.1 protein-S-isoprenylcysteine O-methyltransferase Ste14 [Bradyrhizobium elkanii]MCW2373386.1 protein-S-isoprenylcysteine O-methyltransferase Ste14 [Bradyrhizobium elkanii]
MSAAAMSLSTNLAYDRATRFLGSAWFLLLALAVTTNLAKTGEPWPSLVSNFLVAVFYLMLALLILIRGPAKAQAEGLLPRVAAFVGTYWPWTITFFEKTEGALPNLLSAVCVLTGMIMILVTVRHLGRSFSLVPQARSVVQTGPYRWIKHPLYLSEEIVFLGVVLQHLSWMTVGLLILHICIQVWRIHYEEDVLRRTLPEYSSYEASRWRLIPYVW